MHDYFYDVRHQIGEVPAVKLYEEIIINCIFFKLSKIDCGAKPWKRAAEYIAKLLPDFGVRKTFIRKKIRTLFNKTA